MSTIVTRSGKGSPLTNTEVDANFTNLNTGKAELSGAVFTGAITTNSTIDGRDVATDGTKLDGIEASATADQTGAQIKTAYEAETNAFTDAQFTKLGGIEASADVTANAGALMDSELTSIASVKALNQGVATGDSPTFAGLVATTADINGGTIDGTVIGGATPAAISGTTGQFGTSLNVDGTATMDSLNVDSAGKIGFNTTGTYTLNSVPSPDYGLGYTVSTNPMNLSGYYGLAFATARTERLKIANNGDISFYEDTGTTPKLFWDASAESLGIGTDSPSRALEVYGATAGVISITSNSTDGISSLSFGDTADDNAGRVNYLNASDDMLFYTATAERFRIASDGSLSTPTAGTSNVRFGVNAGNSITSGGDYNVVVGDEAGTAITTGDNNVLVGYASGDAITTGAANTAVGMQALTSNTTGAANVAIGGYQVGITTAALNNNTTGGNNVAIGTGSLNSNTTASNNTAVGFQSLAANTTGASNVAVGTSALLANTTAQENVAVGKDAGLRATTGGFNVCLGPAAGSQLTTGDSNVCIGRLSGSHNYYLSTGINNVLIGALSDTTAADTDNANGIGYDIYAEGGYTTVGNSTSDIRAAHGTATWATVSDQRYKKDIVDSTAGLSFINALQPRTFKYKTLGELPETFSAYEEGSTEVFKNSDTNHGFIAQEIKAAIDADSSIADGFKLWDDRDDGSQEVAEAALIPILVKAIQELTARITTLEG